jgi:hypothetical protein
LDGVELDAIADLESEIRSAATEALAEICRDIENGKSLPDKDLGRIRELAAEVIDRNTQRDSAPENNENSH